jgi:tetratricopeptide (TPR) repeat protein
VQSFQFALQSIDHLNTISNAYEDDRYDPDEQKKQGRSLADIRAARNGDAINRYRASKGMRAITKKRYKRKRDRIKNRLEKARRKLKIELYGEDYVVFKEADRLRHSGKYEQAIEKYRTVIEEFGTANQKPRRVNRKQRKQTVKKKEKEKTKDRKNKQKENREETPSAYVPISILNEAKCLKEMGKHAQAVRKLSRFHREKPLGKYRGEALLELALIHTVKRLDPFPNGQKYFQKLDEWINKVRHQTDLEVLDRVKKEEAFEKNTPPQREYRKRRDPEVLGGGKKKVQVKPGQLVDRKTADWYLTDLEETVAAFRGFLHFVRGNDEQALKHYERMVELDPKNRKGSFALNPNNYTRLRYGPRNGYLVALPEELKLYRGRKRFAVLLVDFLYVQKRFERARTVARRVLDGAAGPMSLTQKDYLYYITGNATLWTDGYKAAYPHYKKVYEHRQGTVTEPRAMFSAGKMALKSREDKLMEEGKKLWKKLIQSGKRTNTVLKTMVSWGTYLGNQQKYRRAIRALKRVPDVEKEKLKKWSSAADFQIKFYRKKLKKKETQP